MRRRRISPRSASTRPFTASRMGRICSSDLPVGSSSSQSSYRFPGTSGQASPHPIVTTTSAAPRNSSVQGLGNSWEMSIPTSAIAFTTSWLSSDPGSEPPDHAMARPAARWLNQPKRHLGAPCVVHAEEQHGGNRLAGLILEWARLRDAAGHTSRPDGQPLGDGGGLRQLVVALEHERLDGLEAEDAVELGVQVFGNVVELHSLLRVSWARAQSCPSPFAIAPHPS